MESNDSRNTIIRYILNVMGEKYPIKYAELLEFVDKDKKALAAVFPSVKSALENSYGVLIKIVPEDKSAGKKFICISEKPNLFADNLNEEQQKQTALLVLILCYIFMRRNRVDDYVLERFLKKCYIYYGQESRHFGNDAKKLITETFVRQLYLKKTKYQGLDADHKRATCSYSWGFRADLEMDKKLMLNFVAKICEKPTRFFKDIFEENNEEVEDVQMDSDDLSSDE